MSKHIYIFSGLGADERVFQKLDLSILSFTFINWVIPYKDETIENYTQRIIEQISIENPILIGLSFGGIIAIEVAKKIKTDKVILLSSVKTKFEIPFYYRIAGLLRLTNLIPPNWFKTTNFINNWFFDTNSKFEKNLLKEIIKDTDSTFLYWAIDQFINWKNVLIPDNLIHIHGTKDRILPIYFLKFDIKIASGGHFMVLNKSGQISRIIHNIVKY